MEERNEFLFKVLVIGEIGVGKTSIIRRYVHRQFSQNYRATIGVDFSLKVLEWDDDTLIRLQLWDVAGSERFGTMTRVYYREAMGAIVVYDLTRDSTFEAINKWKTDLDTKVQLPDGKAIPAVLLGNKSDEKNEESLNDLSESMKSFCEEKRFCAWYPTSAKNNSNIEEATTFLVRKMLAIYRANFAHEKAVEAIDLNKKVGNNEFQSKSCCF